ncbi:ABC transporter ATP-binding protein [Nocardioides sp. zg-1308]|uniref:ABC transporter ATP-binding protein n=1 Tax=Nocardioides renjunii TaxID=3095075 RepID=A0ABU5K5L6_9ACTN|nr:MULTISPECIES: ABC transporter ATP-binding protein [unclassified Nocardioides]MDZ5660254.1 ABC transporter ATP-binding protein [Nocardioides sp. S-58]NPD03367.1 ABC transporter ATP-binding protein [Nocardioides sp. zg-1308]WQQ21264.1 ABC transporter ATP-binding protein [Nocardioides sp. S-34]
MISISHLRKTYGDTVAVDDVSLEVAEGEVLGVLGPNGAGKTTTVECLAGLRVPDSGTVRVGGLDPLTDRDELTRLLGVQLQDCRLQPKITVDEALRLWSALYDDPLPWRDLIGRLGLEEQLRTRFRDLSGGQQQRLSIALALVGRPRVVILDELSTGLDPRARRDVWQIVRDLRADGVTILLVTHSMEEAQQLCDRIAIIDGGRIRALDTPDALIAGATAATVTSFTTDEPVDLESLRDLTSVSAVRAESDRIVVEGRDGAALEVLERLGRQQVTPHGLRVVDGTLDTAYLQLTDTREETPA